MHSLGIYVSDISCNGKGIFIELVIALFIGVCAYVISAEILVAIAFSRIFN